MTIGSGDKKNIKINLCPFCAFNDDRETALAYPSENNYCYHAKPISPINLTHQQEFCLSANFTKCPVFQSEKFTRMPKEIAGRGPTKKPFTALRWLSVVILIALVILLIGVSTGRVDLSFLTLNPPAQVEPTNTSQTLAPAATTEAPTVTFTNSPEPSPSATILVPTSVTPHFIETTFGRNPQLLIHRVQEGEGFIFLASKYGTSVDAIKSINYMLSDTLMINKVIIIPLNTMVVNQLPEFSPYEITSSSYTIEEIASKLKINVDEFIQYNDLPGGYIPQAGEWLLIPH